VFKLYCITKLALSAGAHSPLSHVIISELQHPPEFTLVKGKGPSDATYVRKEKERKGKERKGKERKEKKRKEKKRKEKKRKEWQIAQAFLSKHFHSDYSQFMALLCFIQTFSALVPFSNICQSQVSNPHFN